jgi:hypothetical protein
MILRAYSVRDKKLEIYLNPFFVEHVGQAVRAWDQYCKDPQSPVYKYPEDFCLMEIGSFDSDKAILTTNGTPIIISEAIRSKVKETLEAQAQ